MKFPFRLPAFIIPLLLTTLVCFSLPVFGQSAQPITPITIEGWFSIIYGTPAPGTNAPESLLYLLNTEDGRYFELDLPPGAVQAAGGFDVLNGSYVYISLDAQTNRSVLTTGGAVRVASLQLAVLPLGMPQGDNFSRAVTGSQPWVTIMCAFPGTPAGYGTKAIDYFQGMYSDQYPGLDHYWRQQSFGKINMAGSNAYGWFMLDKPQTHYYPSPGMGDNSSSLTELAQDCINKADATVNFSSYRGINFMFNGSLDCCAWGGTGTVHVDNTYSRWRMTWNPPFSWKDITVVAHEIGHGFNLPHANNYDGDGDPYDNTWDVMSETYIYCDKATHAVYGCLGQHTNAFHKDHLGWFAPQQRLVLNDDRDNITLDHAAMQNPQHYQIVIIPFPNSHKRYVVEARQTSNSNYDAKLAGKAVIIHEVDTARTQWAWLVGGTTDAKSWSVENNPLDPDGAWLAGETFVDAVNGISISVISETANGFVISVDMPYIPPTQDPNANLVLNGDMEIATANKNLPDEWSFKNLTKDKIKCNKPEKNKTFAYTGNCAFMFKGSPGATSKLTQTIMPSFPLTGTLSAEIYTQAKKPAANAKFVVKVFYANGDKAKLKLNILPSASYTWRGNSLGITGSVSRIKFVLADKSSTGKIFVDNIKVTVE